MPTVDVASVIRGPMTPLSNREIRRSANGRRSHIAGHGVDLFRAVCEMDLEGIVAKLVGAPYATEPSSGIKIKNPAYSQAIGRREGFEGMRVRRAASAR